MKKKMFRQVVVLAAVVSMMASLLTGCGNKDDKGSSTTKGTTQGTTKKEEAGKEDSDITIRVLLSDAAHTDTEMVSDAVSEYVKEKLGFGVELVQYGAGEYEQKMSLALLSDEQVDIIWRSGDAFVTAARDGSLMDISKLLPQYAPNLEALIYDDLWVGVTIDDGIYGVPCLKEIANSWGFYVLKSFIDEKGIDLSQIKTLADCEVVLKALVDDGREGLMYATSGWHDAGAFQNYEDVTGDFIMSMEEGNDAIVSRYMTDEYEAFVNLMRDWYNKEYIRKDAATNTEYDASDEAFGLRGVCYSPCGEGDNYYYIELTTPIVTTSAGRGSDLCVASKSEYPEQALQFLELWYTDPELETLMCYGIEGKHYTVTEEGRVERVEGYNNLYVNQTWMGGNMLISPLAPSDPADKWEQYEAWNEAAQTSKFMGFTPSTAAVEAEYAAVKAVVAEYEKLLMCGAVDPAETLPQFRQALKDAGVEKICAELQSQYDEWKASNK